LVRDAMMPEYLIRLIDILTNQEKAHETIERDSCVSTKRGSMIVQKAFLQYHNNNYILKIY
jgi:hypothetical protein